MFKREKYRLVAWVGACQIKVQFDPVIRKKERFLEGRELKNLWEGQKKCWKGCYILITRTANLSVTNDFQ